MHRKFQSTHPRGVRQRRKELSTLSRQFQSTHPRGVRPLLSSYLCRLVLISIHAPTWGATSAFALKRSFIKISIHAPTWGATTYSWRPTQYPYHFNPRTHVGCDIGSQRTFTRKLYFNPRTHVGCDRINVSTLSLGTYFNPRTHVGCDHNLYWWCKGVLVISIHAPTWGATVKPSNGWLLGHKDNEFANENIIIINSVNIT